MEDTGYTSSNAISTTSMISEHPDPGMFSTLFKFDIILVFYFD